MKKIRIFLDLDGVLANFTKAACERFDVIYPTNKKRSYPKWLENEAGIKKSRIDSLMSDYYYWYNIEPYSYAQELVNLAKEIADEVYILSKPMDHESCYAAKIDWCLDKLRLNRKQLIITEAPKYLLAHDYTDILIDDKAQMIEDWIAAGGEAYYWIELIENKEHTKRISAYRLTKIREIVARTREFIKLENDKSNS